MQAMRRPVHSYHVLLASAALFLLSQHYSTALPAAKRYGKRNEAEYPRRTSENAVMAKFALAPEILWKSAGSESQQLATFPRPVCGDVGR